MKKGLYDILAVIMCICVIFSVAACTDKTGISASDNPSLTVESSGNATTEISSVFAESSEPNQDNSALSSKVNSSSQPKNSKPQNSSSVESDTTSNTASNIDTATPPIEDKPTVTTGYWYSKMNTVQQKYYNEILNAAKVLNEKPILLSTDDRSFTENVSLAYNGVVNDHPEIFWLANQYEISISAAKYYIKLFYNQTKAQATENSVKLENKIEEILSRVSGKTDYEKELFFYEYICDNTSYELTDDLQCYSAFGALINGRAVCEGYSRAIQLLLLRSGICSTLVKGTDPSNEGHMWNLVQLDGEWYELDITWDDTGEGTANYKYFNITSKKMHIDHTPAVSYTSAQEIDADVKGVYNFFLPVCTAEKYAYKS